MDRSSTRMLAPPKTTMAPSHRQGLVISHQLSGRDPPGLRKRVCCFPKAYSVAILCACSLLPNIAFSNLNAMEIPNLHGGAPGETFISTVIMPEFLLNIRQGLSLSITDRVSPKGHLSCLRRYSSEDHLPFRC